MDDFDRFLIVGAASSINASNNRIRQEVHQLRVEEAERFRIAQQQRVAERDAKGVISEAIRFYRSMERGDYAGRPVPLNAYEAWWHIDRLARANVAEVNDYQAIADYQVLRDGLPRVRDLASPEQREAINWAINHALSEHNETRATAGILRIAANLDGLPDYDGGRKVSITAAVAFVILSFLVLCYFELIPTFPRVDVFLGGFWQGLGVLVVYPLAVGATALAGYGIAKYAQQRLRRLPDMDLVRRIVAEYNVHERFGRNPWLCADWIPKVETDPIKWEQAANALAAKNNAIREQLMGAVANLETFPVCATDERARLERVAKRDRRSGISLTLGVGTGVVAVMIYLWMAAVVRWPYRPSTEGGSVSTPARIEEVPAPSIHPNLETSSNARTPAPDLVADRAREDAMIEQYFRAWCKVWWATTVDLGKRGDFRADFERLRAELERSGVWANIVPPPRNKKTVTQEEWLLRAVGSQGDPSGRIRNRMYPRTRDARLKTPSGRGPEKMLWALSAQGRFPDLSGLSGPDNRSSILSFIRGHPARDTEVPAESDADDALEEVVDPGRE